MPRPATPTADLLVRAQPRASRDEVVGWRDGVLVVRLTAPPVEGAANRACQRLLARVLDLPPTALALVAGEKSREKRVRVSGLTSEALQAKIDEHLRQD
jgi:uncharacterized protein